jgi:hypothetical protein
MQFSGIEQIHMPHLDASPLEAAMIDRLIVGALKGVAQPDLVAALRERYGPRELHRWPRKPA